MQKPGRFSVAADCSRDQTCAATVAGAISLTGMKNNSAITHAPASFGTSGAERMVEAGLERPIKQIALVGGDWFSSSIGSCASPRLLACGRICDSVLPRASSFQSVVMLAPTFGYRRPLPERSKLWGQLLDCEVGNTNACRRLLRHLRIDLCRQSASCPGGETGRRKGLKIPRLQGRAGSIPAPGTNKKTGFGSIRRKLRR